MCLEDFIRYCLATVLVHKQSEFKEKKMRKFIDQTNMNPTSWQLQLIIRMKEDDQPAVILKTYPNFVEPEIKYTAAQLIRIERVNSALVEKNMPLLTEEEIDWMLDPTAQPPLTIDAMQQLAGFKVVKTIVPTDTIKSVVVEQGEGNGNK